jgi:acyl-coenzyme A thioesterase PaaI-like protein
MTAPVFIYAPDPDNPGWHSWELSDQTRFNGVLGKVIVRADPDGRQRVRCFPQHVHANMAEAIHGGALLAFIDVAMFAAARMHGMEQSGDAVTLDLSTQFIGAGQVGKPLDLVIDILRETGRFVFVRGLVEQGDHLVASFAGTIRKPSRPR